MRQVGVGIEVEVGVGLGVAIVDQGNSNKRTNWPTKSARRQAPIYMPIIGPLAH